MFGSTSMHFDEVTPKKARSQPSKASGPSPYPASVLSSTTPRSGASSTRRVTSGPSRIWAGPSAPHSARPWWRGTAAASCRGARYRPASRSTTRSPSSRAAPHACRTWPVCAIGTTTSRRTTAGRSDGRMPTTRRSRHGCSNHPGQRTTVALADNKAVPRHPNPATGQSANGSREARRALRRQHELPPRSGRPDDHRSAAPPARPAVRSRRPRQPATRVLNLAGLTTTTPGAAALPQPAMRVLPRFRAGAMASATRPPPGGSPRTTTTGAPPPPDHHHRRHRRVDQRSTPRMSPLVGTPVPDVTTTCSTDGTWFTPVPRTWRTPSAIPFMPWM